jgi:ParB family chromosome partitioning protein
MIKDHNFTQESLAQRLGVSRVSIANTLRLLRLPDSIKEMITNKVISEGHSRALLSLANDQQMIDMARQIVEHGLTVRDVEMRVRSKASPVSANSTAQAGGSAAPAPKSSELVALEDELRNLLGTKVSLRGNLNRGTIEIYYAGRDSLHRLIHQLRATHQ